MSLDRKRSLIDAAHMGLPSHLPGRKRPFATPALFTKKPWFLAASVNFGRSVVFALRNSGAGVLPKEGGYPPSFALS